MQTKFRNDIVIHGFRHAIGDRLRNVECPSEAIEQIGGWTTQCSGEKCGDGFDFHSIVRVLERVE